MMTARALHGVRRVDNTRRVIREEWQLFGLLVFSICSPCLETRLQLLGQVGFGKSAIAPFQNCKPYQFVKINYEYDKDVFLLRYSIVFISKINSYEKSLFN